MARFSPCVFSTSSIYALYGEKAHGAACPVPSLRWGRSQHFSPPTLLLELDDDIVESVGAPRNGMPLDVLELFESDGLLVVSTSRSFRRNLTRLSLGLRIAIPYQHNLLCSVETAIFNLFSFLLRVVQKYFSVIVRIVKAWAKNNIFR